MTQLQTSTIAAANPHPLPMAIEEIDLAWLRHALCTRAPEAELHAFEIVSIDHGTCTKIKIHLHLNEAAQNAGIAEQVIVKGGFEPHSRVMSHMHRSEVRGYRDVLPALGLPHPACYFAEYDDDRKQGIVIMEDLTARGVSLCHPLRPHTPAQVSRRLSELARFHARTWASAEIRPGGRWHDLEVVLENDPFAAFLQPEAWQRFVDLPRGRAASVHFHDLEWMVRSLERLRVLAARLPQAVIHCDTHLGNLYVEPDGTPGFFDSLPHRWSPIAEIAYHIGCALDPMERRAAERELVAGYLSELSSYGVHAPDLDETMEHYAAFLAYGYCIFIINDAVWQPEAINTAYTARFSAAMIDNDTRGALDRIGFA